MHSCELLPFTILSDIHHPRWAEPPPPASDGGVEGKTGSSTHTPNPIPHTRTPFMWLCVNLLGYLQQDGMEFHQEVAKLCVMTIAYRSTYMINLCVKLSVP